MDLSHTDRAAAERATMNGAKAASDGVHPPCFESGVRGDRPATKFRPRNSEGHNREGSSEPLGDAPRP